LSASEQVSPAARYSDVSRVLLRVMLLNLLVALAKIVFGYASGAISILSDGFHSLADAASNVVGLVGIQAARQPADKDHPYGHRKYETVAAAAVTGFLLLVLFEVLRHAFDHLSGRSAPPDVSFVGVLIMAMTLVINLAVVRYESSEASRLGSEVLLADAMQTRGDVWTSVAVIAALVVAGFIGHSAFQIGATTTHILSDRMVMSASDIERVVLGVAGVLGCHQVRTRGSEDHVFLDLHVWFPGEMILSEAHALSHDVKDRLMASYPQIADVVIHLEPPPQP
jgi:cation diffusion facilitator family transporter